MSNITKIARPYATAVFAVACDKKADEQWEINLKQMANVVCSLKEVMEKGQFLSSAMIADIILECAPPSEDLLKKFIHLLAENRRLLALPEIVKQFEMLRLEKNNIVTLKVESAFPVKNVSAFNTFLSEKLQKAVQVTYEHNPDLLGGVRIYMNDDVVDASIFGRLQRVRMSLQA